MKIIKPDFQRFTLLTFFIMIVSFGAPILSLMYFQKHGWQTDDLPAVFLFVLILYVSLFALYMDDKQTRSIELSDDGISYLKLNLDASHFSSRPILERRMLRWGDMQNIETQENLIIFKGYKQKVALNTIAFNDRNELLEFIKKNWQLKKEQE